MIRSVPYIYRRQFREGGSQEAQVELLDGGNGEPHRRVQRHQDARPPARDEALGRLHHARRAPLHHHGVRQARMSAVTYDDGRWSLHSNLKEPLLTLL